MKKVETKATRFDMLAVGDRFQFVTIPQVTEPDALDYKKVSARKAIMVDELGDAEKDAEEFAIWPSDEVLVYARVGNVDARGQVDLSAHDAKALRGELGPLARKAAEARRDAAPRTVSIVAVTADARPISAQFDSFEAAAHEVVRWSKDHFYTQGRPLVTVVMARGEFVTKFDFDSDGSFPRSWQRVWTLDAEQGR